MFHNKTQEHKPMKLRIPAQTYCTLCLIIQYQNLVNRTKRLYKLFQDCTKFQISTRLDIIISFLLFLETVRFYSLENSGITRCWPGTKRFWKIRYRLFNAKFLYFLGGPKGVGQLKEDTASLGLKANSKIPAINFAVPSLTIL